MWFSFKTLRLFFLFFSALFIAATAQENPFKNRFVIEKISVEGNSKSGSYVVYENLPYAIGDTLSEEEIYSGIEFLKSKELFNDVTLKPRAGSAPGKLHLIILVEERYWPQFRFKGGFSELDGWFLTPLSLNMDNILGMGNSTELGITFGDRITSIELNYINPNIFDSDLDFYFSLFVHGQQILHYFDGQQIIHNVPQGGIYLGFRPRQGFFRNFKFGLLAYSITPDSVATAGSTKIRDFPSPVSKYVGEKWQTSAFSISFNLDKRDQGYNPSSGYWLGINYIQADSRKDNRISFSRLVIDVRKYQHLFSNVVLAGRFKFGTVSPDAPFWEKFYLGGPNSLRGFSDRILSPVGGGDKLYQAGVEIRFPISQKHYPKNFLTGVIFFDSGANLLSDEKLNDQTISSSAGFGFRFRLPFLGIVRMDLAYPLKNNDRKVQFSLGHTF